MKPEPTCPFCGATLYGREHTEISSMFGPPCPLEGYAFDPDEWRRRPLNEGTFSFMPPDNSEVMWLRSLVKDLVGRLK